MSRFDVHQNCDDLMQAQLLPPSDDEAVVPLNLRPSDKTELVVISCDCC